MKGMSRIKRGEGFRGLVMYSLFGKKGEADYGIGHGYVIGGSVSSHDPKAMIAEFEAIASTRPDIEKPVWHNSLRQPDNEDLSDAKWQEVAERYLEIMGFDLSKTLYAIVKHKEQHVHLDVCRVLMDGSVYLGQNENLKSAKAIAQLENEFGLTQTKNAIDANGNFIMSDVAALKKNEIDKAARTGIRPPKLVMQEAVEAAMHGRPTVAEFVERLEGAGIEVRPNVAPSTGRLNGFSFSYGGLSMGGKKLGDKYKWSRLSTEVHYDKDRDGPILSSRSRNNQAPADGGRLGNGDRPDSARAGGSGADDPEDHEADPADRAAAGSDREEPGMEEAHATLRRISQPKLIRWKAAKDERAARKRREAEEQELLEIYEHERKRKIKIAIEVRLAASRMVCADEDDWRTKRINPKRSKWLAMREDVLVRQYGRSSNHLVKMFQVSYSPPRREIVFKNAAAYVIDKGPLITAREGNSYEIEAMLELAKLKRWKSLKFRGSAKFKAAAMKRALDAGFKVSTENEKDARILREIMAERAPTHQATPRFVAPSPQPSR